MLIITGFTYFRVVFRSFPGKHKKFILFLQVFCCIFSPQYQKHTGNLREV